MRTWQKYTWPQTQLQRPRSALKFVFVVCCVNTDPTIDRCAWRCVVSLSTRMYPWFRERSVALVTARLGSKQRAHARRTIHTYNIGYISLFFLFSIVFKYWALQAKNWNIHGGKLWYLSSCSTARDEVMTTLPFPPSWRSKGKKKKSKNGGWVPYCVCGIRWLTIKKQMQVWMSRFSAHVV